MIESRSRIILRINMKSMRSLHSCLCWRSGKRMPIRIIEEPTFLQAKILSVFYYKIKGGAYKKYSGNILILLFFYYILT